MELNSLKTDPKKELEGVWEDLGDDAKVLVARVGNSAFQQEYGKLPRGTRRMIENNTLNNDKSEAILSRIMANTILLGWEGIKENDKTIKYSVENATKVLKDIPEFRSIIWELANEFQRFHEESVEADVKN